MTQSEEIGRAKRAGDLPPRCVVCGEPLDRVGQYVEYGRDWIWDEETRRYLVLEDPRPEPPSHRDCEVEDWDLADEELFPGIRGQAYAG